MIAAAGKAYSALHDIDANKPSGSIKIRVKTYAHTLMLLREKLEDQGLKLVELDRKVTEKKLELMASLKAKLESVGKTDSNLDAQITDLAQKVAAWRAEEEAKRPKGKKPIGLKVVETGTPVQPATSAEGATSVPNSPRK